ncbi:hypothetical protein GDO81_004079 [Engystomops pustulosus]|uniref:Uncharacterized protein n=1 Tax=Engystomops pustulosus TaxID=76066 RepID=A0AAV6ZTP2_ENGPU|nr:hypothetical protein GDO81_004079 [Engystomops pustulosus]
MDSDGDLGGTHLYKGGSSDLVVKIKEVLILVRYFPTGTYRFKQEGICPLNPIFTLSHLDPSTSFMQTQSQIFCPTLHPNLLETQYWVSN